MANIDLLPEGDRINYEGKIKILKAKIQALEEVKAMYNFEKSTNKDFANTIDGQIKENTDKLDQLMKDIEKKIELIINKRKK